LTGRRSGLLATVGLASYWRSTALFGEGGKGKGEGRGVEWRGKTLPGRTTVRFPAMWLLGRGCRPSVLQQLSDLNFGSKQIITFRAFSRLAVPNKVGCLDIFG